MVRFLRSEKLLKLGIIVVLLIAIYSCASFLSETNKGSMELIAVVNIKPPDHAVLTFGGLSGIDYLPSSNSFYAISDDRSLQSAARFYRFKLNSLYQVTDLQTFPLKDENGFLFEKHKVDAESIRYHPGGWIVWSSELPHNKPSIYVTNVSSMETSVFKLPDYIYPDSFNGVGSRKNKFIEGITFTPDYKFIIFAVESSLQQDGAVSDLSHGSNNRILMFDAESQDLVAEYFYGLDPIPYAAEVPPLLHDNGISEILAIDESTLLVLERAGRHIGEYDFSYDSRIYRVNLDRCNKDFSKKIVKEHFLSIGRVFDGRQENLEGMSLGPMINGRRTLYLISDNNFHPDHATQLLVFLLDR